MKREIRASSIAGTAGVGAVVDVGQESFVIPGLEKWKQEQLQVVHLRRLSDRLKKVLKAPREGKPSLLVRRFPRAMFCEKCRRITMWKTELEKEGEEPTCPHEGCSGRLVAMRFVAACEHGHLDDVDWRRWAHTGRHAQPGCRHYGKLEFRIDPGAATGGLASLKVQCECGSYRSLEDIANKALVKEVFQSCAGRHPWIFGSAENCAAEVVILQRGATNLHYPCTVSALDIPVDIAESPASQFAEQVKAQAKFERLVNFIRDTSGANKELIDAFAELIAGHVGCEESVVVEIATAQAEGRPIAGSKLQSELTGAVEQSVFLEEEWRTIRAALAAGEMVSGTFAAIAEEVDDSAPSWVKALVEGVLLIRRLREVRAYLGFQRVKPGPADRTVRPDVGHLENWVPATEVFGEGFVLAFNFAALESWSASLPQPEVKQLDALEKKRLDENFWFLPPVDAAFLAIHTLSHLLLRQVTFDCGYSSSSLRERIYFDRKNRYAGLMIYTADADSEGSLGGLVRQGRSDRLALSLIQAVESGRWCSSDPVCSETAGQGLGGFNRAACHACSLVAETSCTHANTLLDRRMLVDPALGLLPRLGAEL
jgi:Domain of unknown function (DUF1998)